MPISVACSCGKSFAAKDELAGRTVRCPACQQPITIPAASGGGLDDLLAESGFSQHAFGVAQCPSCHAAMAPGAVVCVQCGFNSQLGRKMDTLQNVDMDTPLGTAPMSDAERMLAKAEQELRERPIQQSDAEYGDGADAYLVMFGMFIVSVVMAGLTGVFLYLYDKYIASSFGAGQIALFAGIIIGQIGAIWLVVLAFLESVGKGLLCLFCGPYTLYFAVSKIGDATIPAVMYLVGLVASIGAQVGIGLSGG